MTEGSSQGLFVIVAVVIFGIFVLISYILFREHLKTGLGTIFEDSIEETFENSTSSHFLPIDPYFSNNTENKGITTHRLNYYDNYYWGEITPIGFHNSESVSGSDRVVIPYGYKFIVELELKPTKDTQFIVDYNIEQVHDGTPYLGDSNKTNPKDSYGTNDSNQSYSRTQLPLKKDEWNKVSFYLTNNHFNNVKKFDVKNFSRFGIERRYFFTEDSFESRNVKYKLVKSSVVYTGEKEYPK